MQGTEQIQTRWMTCTGRQVERSANAFIKGFEEANASAVILGELQKGKSALCH